MAIALRHPITARIDDQASFLRTLLDEYPKFLKDWEDKSEKEFRQIAKDNSDEDRAVESTIYSSLCTAFDNDADKENLFYQSVFLMCYSYYESCIALLSKNAKSKEIINAICKSQNITLSEDALNAIEYLQSDMNTLRNNLCHNNFGTIRKADVMKKLSEQNTGLNYDNNVLSFTGTAIIIDALEKNAFGIA